MAIKPDDLIDRFSQLSNNAPVPSAIHSGWLVPYPTKEGYSFRCPLSLKELVNRKLIECYFRKLLFIITEEKHIVDFHMRLRPFHRQGLTIYVQYDNDDERSDPPQTSLCISCDMNNPLSKSSLLEEHSTTRIWLDGQLRNKLIVTPRRHIEKLSEMTQEEMLDFWRVTQVFLEQRQCPWQSMILNHGNYRKHAHLHMKINIKPEYWNRSIKNKYREKIQEMDQLLNHNDNTDLKMYFGGRGFNQWSGIKER